MTAQTSATERAPAAELQRLATNETVIERSSGWPSLRLDELREARELLYFLTWRDVKVRYKQTALGVAWAVLQPLLTDRRLHALLQPRGQHLLRGDSVSGLLARGPRARGLFFVGALTLSSQSLVGEREPADEGLLPAARDPDRDDAHRPSRTSLIGFALLLIVMAAYGVAPALWIVLLPLIFLIVLAAALGVSLLAVGAQRDRTATSATSSRSSSSCGSSRRRSPIP